MSNAPTSHDLSPDGPSPEGGPPGGDPGRSTSTVLGIVAALVLIVVLVGGGILVATSGDDGDGDTAAETSTTQVKAPPVSGTEPVSDTEGSGSPTTEEPGPRELPLDGEPIIRVLDGYLGHPYEVEIPAGVTATIVATPVDRNIDIVLTDGTTETDLQQRGAPEELTIVGPASKTIQVDNFFGGSGSYEITMRSS